MSGRSIVVLLSLATAGIVLVSALPAPAVHDEPDCLSATATPEELGPSATPDDLRRGFVCRENGEVVGGQD